jgi:hypothetical protein
MTKARLIGIAALASLALLVPAGSAKANSVPFCTSLHPGTYAQWDPVVLAPGKACSFFPVAVSSFSAAWTVTKPGHGAVCAGVVKSPPGYPNGKPLDPVTGAPIAWGVANKSPCADIARYRNVAWGAQNGFGAVAGQPVIINFSTATLKTDNLCCLLFYY